MNFVQIQHFMMIMKYMNLTKAAKELYITQPALSHSLAKMEKELGIPLFYRDNNRLVLTKECSKIFYEISNVYESYEAMMRKAQEIKEREQEQINLGFSGSVVTFSSFFFSGMFTSYQDIPINKVFADVDEIKLMLKNDRLDLAITFPPIQSSQLVTRIIDRDEIVLVMKRSHPLANLDTVTVEQMQQYKFEVLTKPNPYRRYLDNLLEQNHITIQTNERDYRENLDILNKNLTDEPILALSPSKRVPQWYRGDFIYKHIEGVTLELVTGLSWKKDSDISYKYKGFIQEVEETYKDIDAVDVNKVFMI